MKKVFWKKYFNNINKNKLKNLIKLLAIFSSALLSIFLFFSLIIYFYISKYSKEFIYNDISLIPNNKVGLTLGTSPVTGNGDTSQFFITRMEAAKKLKDNNKIEYILVSGDNRSISYNEPKYMKNYLLKLGVESGIIIPDYAGRRTLDSVLRSNEIFNQNSITIISQKFHNERAIFIARKNGINAIAFNAVDPYPNTFKNILQNTRTYTREILARDIAIFDFVFNKRPEILGETIEIKNEDLIYLNNLILEK